MIDFLKDQAFFMTICGQTVGQDNPEQLDLYGKLIREEDLERRLAICKSDLVEELDADIDLLVVLLGRMLSRWPEEMIRDAWKEVMRSNLSKAIACDCTGMGDCQHCGGTGYVVVKRDDGKILKPATYSKPDVRAVFEKYHN